MSDKNTNKDNKKSDGTKSKKKMSLLAKILFGLAGAIVLLVIVVVCYVLHLLSLPEIVPDDGTNVPKITTTVPTTDSSIISTGDVTEPTTPQETETTEDLSGLEEITVPSTAEGETTVRETAAFRTEEKVYNIILLGIDPTDGLSDSMIVVTINQNDNTIKLTSFMRDMFIEHIPGLKPNRLNTIYNNGGMKLLKQIFKEYFGIELHGFVSVDYDVLVKVVDALGGIELYVSEAEANFLNTSNYIKDEASLTLIPGATQQMNGYQVAGFCRLRYVSHKGETDDFARTRRQREVLIAMYNKFRSSDITTLIGLLEKVLPLVKTDLDKGEMISMATKALSGVKNEIEQLRIPVKGGYSDLKYRSPDGNIYMRVVGWDMEKNVKAIHEFMYGAE
ncbi:MAG: LCP family protein [Lachnospiraceae bacterium]|nr:LCP family protein [Lachnospiraceae bacterium]